MSLAKLVEKPVARQKSMLYALASFAAHRRWAKEKFVYEHAQLLMRLGFKTESGGAMLDAALREMR